MSTGGGGGGGVESDELLEADRIKAIAKVLSTDNTDRINGSRSRARAFGESFGLFMDVTDRILTETSNGSSDGSNGLGGAGTGGMLLTGYTGGVYVAEKPEGAGGGGGGGEALRQEAEMVAALTQAAACLLFALRCLPPSAPQRLAYGTDGSKLRWLLSWIVGGGAADAGGIGNINGNGNGNGGGGGGGGGGGDGTAANSVGKTVGKTVGSQITDRTRAAIDLRLVFAEALGVVTPHLSDAQVGRYDGKPPPAHHRRL